MELGLEDAETAVKQQKNETREKGTKHIAMGIVLVGKWRNARRVALKGLWKQCLTGGIRENYKERHTRRIEN